MDSLASLPAQLELCPAGDAAAVQVCVCVSVSQSVSHEEAQSL
jgi:hypothetical protein